MKFSRTNLEGLLRIEPRVHIDNRGRFVKTFRDDVFRGAGIAFQVKEEFFSISRQGVLRGMHFQLPPAQHAKLVYCIKGSVLDVVLDIRRGSPTYGCAHAEELNEDNIAAFFIPAGFAHGFLTLTKDAVMIYNTDAAYSPSLDTGIHWNSFGFAWGVAKPILSERDASLPPFQDFSSLF